MEMFLYFYIYALYFFQRNSFAFWRSRTQMHTQTCEQKLLYNLALHCKIKKKLLNCHRSSKGQRIYPAKKSYLQTPIGRWKESPNVDGSKKRRNERHVQALKSNCGADCKIVFRLWSRYHSSQYYKIVFFNPVLIFFNIRNGPSITSITRTKTSCAVWIERELEADLNIRAIWNSTSIWTTSLRISCCAIYKLEVVRKKRDSFCLVQQNNWK